MVVSYRRFGTTYLSHLPDLRKWDSSLTESFWPRYRLGVESASKQKWVPGISPGGLRRSVLGADNFTTFRCRLSGSALTYGPVQNCTAIALLCCTSERDLPSASWYLLIEGRKCAYVYRTCAFKCALIIRSGLFWIKQQARPASNVCASYRTGLIDWPLLSNGRWRCWPRAASVSLCVTCTVCR